MDIAALLSDRAQAFIQQHQESNLADLMLAQKGPHGISLRELVQQIKGRKMARSKVPDWYETPGIVYGKSKSLEQCSSEITAVYKSKLVSGDSMADLTGGLGVDSYYLGRNFSKFDFVEPDPLLCRLAKNNFEVLAADHIHIINQTAEDYLKLSTSMVDWIYLDPDRRPTESRQYEIKDCNPKVGELLPDILRRTSNIMIKLSPMLDIHSAIKELKYVKALHVVSIRNECKELVFIIERGYGGEVEMTAANFTPGGGLQSFTFEANEEASSQCNFSEPLNYLYEPNASLMKLGAFKTLCNRYLIQ
jgi:hypothetical protein